MVVRQEWVIVFAVPRGITVSSQQESLTLPPTTTSSINAEPPDYSTRLYTVCITRQTGYSTETLT